MKAIKLAKERGEWSDHPTGDFVYEKPEEGTWPPKKKPLEKKDKDVAYFAHKRKYNTPKEKMREALYKEHDDPVEWLKAVNEKKEKGEWYDDPYGDYNNDLSPEEATTDWEFEAKRKAAKKEKDDKHYAEG